MSSASYKIRGIIIKKEMSMYETLSKIKRCKRR